MPTFSFLSLPRRLLLLSTVGACGLTFVFASDTLSEAKQRRDKGLDPTVPQPPRQRLADSSPFSSSDNASSTSRPEAQDTLPRRLALLQQHLYLSLPNLRNGHYETLLTHTFTHTDMGHLLMNMFGLWGFGASFLYIYGPWAYIATWVGAGVGGGALGVWNAERKRRKAQEEGRWKEAMTQVVSYGASASVLGLVTALGMASPRQRIQIMFIPVGIPNYLMLPAFAAFSLAAEMNGIIPQWGHVAHLGGMAFGATFWLLWLRRRPWQMGGRGFPAQRMGMLLLASLGAEGAQRWDRRRRWTR